MILRYFAPLCILALPATGAYAQDAPDTEAAVDAGDDAWVGEYRDRNSFEMFHGLLLREDGTFEWAISVGAMDRRSSGTWEIRDGFAVLTTTPTPVAPVFEQGARNEAEDAPFLLVSWPNGNGIPGIDFTLLCEDGKQITHYTQQDGWNLVPGECDAPVSIQLEESINDIGPTYFSLEGETGGLHVILVPNDFGVEDMTGTQVMLTETGVLLGLRGDFVEMLRVARD